jgi:hypothetical protein
LRYTEHRTGQSRANRAAEMKSREIPNEIINEIAKEAGIKDQTHVAAFAWHLRRLIRDISDQNSRFQRTVSGVVTGNKRDLNDIAQISKLSAELSRKLAEISPRLRSEFAQLTIFPRIITHPKPQADPLPPETVQEVVSTLHDYSNYLRGVLSDAIGEAQRSLRNIFFRTLYLCVVEKLGGHLTYSGSGRSGNVPYVLDRLRPYLPKEFGKASDLTAWKAMRGIKISKKS